MDMESPLAKVLEFLERYQDRRWWLRPNPQEASFLQDLIIAKSAALTTPHLETQLHQLSRPLRKFLLSHVAAPSTGVFYRSSGGASSDASTNGAVPSLGHHDNATGNVQLLMDASSATDTSSSSPFYQSTSDRGRQVRIREVRDSAGWECQTNNHEVSGGSSKEPPSRGKCVTGAAIDAVNQAMLMSLPVDMGQKVGREFFLDLVTAASPLANSASPLVLVGAQANINLGLVQSEAASRKLMSYLRVIEAGYPDNGCEYPFALPKKCDS
jgi:hypothetical protein